MSRLSVALVGAGRLASALARTVRGADVEFLGCHGRREAATEALLELAGSGSALALEETAEADLVFLAVSDDVLSEVAARIANTTTERARVWLHGSGALGPEVLGRLRSPRSGVGCLHPLASLPEGGDATLEGCHMVLCGDEDARELAMDFAESLGGRPVWVAEMDRPLYHAACALLANGTTALFSAGLELLERASRSRLGRNAALGLVRSAFAPLESQDPSLALTGPVRRGDAQTIERHRAALRRSHPAMLPLYDALMQVALSLAVDSGLDAPDAERIRDTLRSTGTAESGNQGGEKP